MRLTKNYSLLLVALLFASATMWTGCVEDPCAETICFNNGTCNEIDGSCDCTGNFTGATCEECAEGWQGVDCDEEIPALSEKFSGTFDVLENCNLDGQEIISDYVSVIAGDSDDETKISISNFWGLFVAPVEATVDGSTVTIPLQDPDNDGFQVLGTGTLNDAEDRITFNFTITDTVYGDSYSCSAFFDKQ